MPMYGVQFGMDGPSLDGTTWYNPKTNDVIKIRSNYFEDSIMKIQTSDGRSMTLDYLRDYVQWKGNGEPPKTPIQESKEELPPEVASLLDNSNDNDGVDGILPEDLDLIQPKTLGNTNSKRINLNNINITNQTVNNNTTNYNIIDRALNKTSKPDWNLVMKWNKFPQKELDMLVSIMDIPIDEISDYYMNKIQRNFDAFVKDIKDQLGSYIKTKLYPEEESKTPPKKSIKKKNA